jgi:serine/threonine protein kinase
MIGRFGKFVLLQRIGGSRLSQVFLVGPAPALEPGEWPPVALKRVSPAMIGEPAFVTLVVREAGLLARLDHPSLCACHELGVVDGCPFLTLDLVAGCTLRALMRRLARHDALLPPSAVIALGHQLAEVLDYLHRRCPTPLVHLDLSPQNVMVAESGALKLIDFGIARFLDGHAPPPVGERIAGTIGYMSPEQARGEPVDARADQFGLGILLYELCAGRRLYRGNTQESWRRMRHGSTPPLAEAIARAPEELRAVVARLLAPRPELRFPEMGAAREALAAASSTPLSGQRPLAALVALLLGDPAFDPFDTRLPRERDALAVPDDLPRGEHAGPPLGLDGYAEIRIEIADGAGTPGSLVREAISASRSGELPAYSPFLEPGDLEGEQAERAIEAGGG